MLLLLARRYAKGDGPWEMNELAIKLRLPVSLIEEQIQHLVEAGLVGLMTRPEGVSLTKPLELISIMDVLNTVHKGQVADATVLLDGDDAIRDVLSRRDKALAAALAGHTLQSLLESSTTGRPREDVPDERMTPFVSQG